MKDQVYLPLKVIQRAPCSTYDKRLQYFLVSWDEVVHRKSRALLLMLGMAVLLNIADSSAIQSPQESSQLLERGKSIYTSLCQRCHGENGSDVSYPGIIPLPGIDKRFGEHEIAKLSAPFVGKTFEGDEARALAAYLGQLQGEKGFAEPGFLFSPYLLEKKKANVRGYRILDVRPKKAYDQAHIANALHWAPAHKPEYFSQRSSVETAQALAMLGVSPEIFVVIYDERGGPDAAAVWWNIRRSGHQRVAVLDGGWRALQNEGYPGSRSQPRIEPVPFNTPASRLQPGMKRSDLQTQVLRLGSPSGAAESKPDGIQIDWRRTVTDSGLKSASEVATYFDQAGLTIPGRYRIEGSQSELGFLIFLLHLLGNQTAYDPEHHLLLIQLL